MRRGVGVVTTPLSPAFSKTITEMYTIVIRVTLATYSDKDTDTVTIESVEESLKRCSAWQDLLLVIVNQTWTLQV